MPTVLFVMMLSMSMRSSAHVLFAWSFCRGRNKEVGIRRCKDGGVQCEQD
jgi:hypothetical protein